MPPAVFTSPAGDYSPLIFVFPFFLSLANNYFSYLILVGADTLGLGLLTEQTSSTQLGIKKINLFSKLSSFNSTLSFFWCDFQVFTFPIFGTQEKAF